MKKLILLSLLPILALGGYAIAQVSATSDPDYDVTLGNILSATDYEPNHYIEIPDKVTETYDVTIPDTFDLMAQDSELELYLEPENLAIAVRVKDNGYVYSSYNFNDTFAGKSDAVVNPIKSGVSLDLYKESTPVTTSYLDFRPIATGESVAAATSTIENLSNGFTAKVDFDHPEIMIKFDLTVTLENGRLMVHIPADSIVEYNPNLFDSTEQFYLLRNIVVFPYFGSTAGEDDGYVMIPDGSGALITLEDDPLIRSSFSLNVYGKDLGYQTVSFRQRSYSTKEFKRITMPIFGIVHNVSNTGFYVTVEEGANYSVLNFKSSGVINDYYKTHFSYRYRESYEQYQSRSNEDQYRISFQEFPNDSDVTVKYSFLSGSSADYVGMAKQYQQDLIAGDQFPSNQRSVFAQTPTKVDFIGTEITPGVLRLKIKEITRYDEVTEILQTLQADGYSELVTTLKNYDMGEDGYRFNVFRELGGKSDFRDMLSYLEDNDIPFSYYLDYVRSYSDRSNEHAQTLSKREIFNIEFSWMFFGHNVNDTKFYKGFAEDDVKDMNKYGIDAIAMGGLERAIYTGWDDEIINSTTNLARIRAMLDVYESNDIQVGMSNPDSYLFPYLSAYYDAPISSSDFAITAASIPFVQLVLGGYVDMYSPHLNFASDEDFTLLRLVEFGVYPSYVFTGGSSYDVKKTSSSSIYISEYDVLKTRIATYYDFLDPGLTQTIGKEMVDHSYVAEGVVLVEYDDGSQILLNYNNSAVTIETTTVPAQGYVVISWNNS